MANKVATIQTADGDVHTGKIVNVNDHLVRDVVLAAFCPPTILMGASEPTVTVEHNGERYSGQRLK